MFWLFRITDSSPAFPHSVQSFLETLCVPIEWLHDRMPIYDAYISWLMELLMV